MNAGDAQVSLYENGGVTMQAVAGGDQIRSHRQFSDAKCLQILDVGWVHPIPLRPYQSRTTEISSVKNVGVGGKTLSTYFDALRLGDEIFGLSYDTGGRSWNSTLYSLWNGATAKFLAPPIPIRI